MPVTFTAVKLPHGWLGNMSPFPVEHNGKCWRTTEALFQALRFGDEAIKEEIRGIASPFAAKLRAKKIANEQPDMLVIERMSKQDLANMKMVLRLKLKHHPVLKQQLLDTGDETIIEDATRQKSKSKTFWGAILKDGKWVGENVMGKMWMKLREELKQSALQNKKSGN